MDLGSQTRYEENSANPALDVVPITTPESAVSNVESRSVLGWTGECQRTSSVIEMHRG